MDLLDKIINRCQKPHEHVEFMRRHDVYYVVFDSGHYFCYYNQRKFGRWFDPDVNMNGNKVHHPEKYLDSIENGTARLTLEDPHRS